MTPRRRRVARLLFAVLPLLSCETVLPPLRGNADVGRDRYAVFVGGEPNGDLYVYAPNPGLVFPITYTAVAELAPALSPDGEQVALLRAGALQDSTPATAWVINLRTGADRELPLPRRAGAPRRIGWSPDGRAIFVVADTEVYRFEPPPGRAAPHTLTGAERVAAESSFAVLLGDPIFARVVRCDGGQALCTVGDTGVPEVLVHGGRDPARWGRDSVAYFIGDALEVRPLGPGRVHRVDWSNPPVRPRALTFFPGRPTTLPPPPP